MHTGLTVAVLRPVTDDSSNNNDVAIMEYQLQIIVSRCTGKGLLLRRAGTRMVVSIASHTVTAAVTDVQLWPVWANIVNGCAPF